MKRILFAISTMAAMLAVSCNKEETIKVSEEPEYYEVKIGMGGAITSEIGSMTKSEESEERKITGIAILSRPVDSNESYHYYGYGLFEDGTAITAKLLKGYTYVMKAGYGDTKKNAGVSNLNGIFGHRSANSTTAFETSHVDNTIHYSLSESINFQYVETPVEMYYGCTEDYSPTENGSVSITMRRVSYGLKVTALNCTDGSIVVDIVSSNNNKIGTFELNSATTTAFTMFTMYKGAERPFSDSEYEETKIVTAKLIDSNNVETSLGSASVIVKANKLTTITVNAAAPTISNGLSLMFSNDDMTDNDTSYEIGGGESSDTPIEQN